MIASHEQFSNRRELPEPLPADMPPELAALDSLLAAEAGRSSIPADLTQSVFARSRAHLPKPHLAPQPSRVAASAWTLPVPRLLRASLKGRLAMAAGLGIAFVLTALFMQVPATTTEAPALDDGLAWHLERLDRANIEDLGWGVSFLEDTRELSSVEEVVGPIYAGLETM